MSIIKQDYGEVGGSGKLVYVDHGFIQAYNSSPNYKDFTIDPTKDYYLFCHGGNSTLFNSFYDKDFYISNGTSEVIHEDTDNTINVSITFPNSTTLRFTNTGTSATFTLKLYEVG